MNTISSENSLLLIIDVQEKLVKMLNDTNVYRQAVNVSKAAGILGLPVIISEQYPKGLGSTIEEIKQAVPEAHYIEKTNFSVLNEPDFKEKLKSYNKKQIILIGIEAHICVLQTAADLLNAGYEVFVVQNACGSRCDENKQAALRRLIHSGCAIVTTEMVLFELLKGSKHPKFKEVQSIIK